MEIETPDETISIITNAEYLPAGSSVETILTTNLPDDNFIKSQNFYIFTDNHILLVRENNDYIIPNFRFENTHDELVTLSENFYLQTGLKEINFKLLSVTKTKHGSGEIYYDLNYVGILDNKKTLSDNALWHEVNVARELESINQNRILFETLFNESKFLAGKYTKTFHDVCDSAGKLTGQSLAYGTIHRRGLWHKGVRVWMINDDGYLLIQKRSSQVHTFPGLYESTAGGHINAGETSLETAINEVSEEVGIDIEGEDLILLGSVTDQFTNQSNTIVNNEIDDIYVVKYNFELPNLNKNDFEVGEFVIVDAHEFLNRGLGKDESIIYRPDEFKLLLNWLTR